MDIYLMTYLLEQESKRLNEIKLKDDLYFEEVVRFSMDLKTRLEAQDRKTANNAKIEELKEICKILEVDWDKLKKEEEGKE